MTDQPTTPPTDGPDQKASEPASGAADETFGWTTDPEEEANATGPGQADRMVSQLQSMIDSIATQAAPVVRQIGIKAAELAAAAADRAGPIAHKAADATADASVRIAERSRVIAAELRRDVATASSNGGGTAVLEEEPPAAADAPSDAGLGATPGEDQR
jgi:hypothetical protein